MKGALESLTDYMYLIIAIVIGGMMFYFIATSAGLFGGADDTHVYGDSIKVSQKIAKEIDACWNKHRGGLDSMSDVCIELEVNATQAFSEWTVTKQLDCKKIPNNYCDIGNCTFCISPAYDDNDRVGWDVKNNNALVSISYSGYERNIMVQEVGPGQMPKAPANNSTSSCIGEGQIRMASCPMPNWTAPPQCCSGLIELNSAQMYKNLTDCQRVDLAQGACNYTVCAKCGDGICNSTYENKCNCPPDCVQKADKAYYMLFLQLNSQVPDFQQKANDAKDAWVEISPLRECPDKVKAIIVTDRICNGPDQQGICNSDGTMNHDVADATASALSDCETNWAELAPYRNMIARVLAIVPGSYVCTFPNVNGNPSGVYSYTTQDVGESRYLVSSDAMLVEKTATMVMGLSYGLCMEGYAAGPCSNCGSGYCSLGSGNSCMGEGGYCCPNKPDRNSILCVSGYCNSGCTYDRQFGQSSYSYLQTVLSKYCGQ
jgi:hypothetical protein